MSKAVVVNHDDLDIALSYMYSAHYDCDIENDVVCETQGYGFGSSVEDHVVIRRLDDALHA